jgi:hypothetical protein
MAIEVRTVGPEAFEEILPLLGRFPSPLMSRSDWRWMLFGYPWPHDASTGFALYANGRAVGFLGAVFSTRPVLGRVERFCCASSWIVLEEHRNASLLLLKPFLALREHTLVNLTPSPVAYEVFSRLGFRPLESEQLLLPPVPGPSELAGSLAGSYDSSPVALERGLAGEELSAYRDMSSSPVAHHLLLQRGGRTCYLVATRTRKRRLPLAEVQHVGDPEFFWENRLLAHRALCSAMGVSGLAIAIDGRFGTRRPPALAVRWPMRRLYRPAHEAISPERIDGLYSELMGLRL